MSKKKLAIVPPVAGTSRVDVHPILVRVWHWLNAFAMIIMIMSGWRIYNASPVFPSFRFYSDITLGGWLGGALQWHFAAMWLLMANFCVYLIYGFWTGHFRVKLWPITPKALLHDLAQALRFKLSHEDIREYNAIQRLAYVGVLAAIVLTILAGLAIWKPVQFQTIAFLMGGYDGARVVHFFGMTAIVAFIVVHLVLVLLVPSTFLPMLTGTAQLKRPAKAQAKGARS